MADVRHRQWWAPVACRGTVYVFTRKPLSYIRGKAGFPVLNRRNGRRVGGRLWMRQVETEGLPFLRRFKAAL